MKIYISSKIGYADTWKYYRDKLKYSISSTWIDFNDVSDWVDLWDRCIKEASECDALVVYQTGAEILKGALVEVGAALSHGKPVFVCAEMEQTVYKHRLVTRCESLEEALLKAGESDDRDE
jgi:hypothetical protein